MRWCQTAVLLPSYLRALNWRQCLFCWLHPETEPTLYCHCPRSSAALLFIETASYLPNLNPCLKVYFISVYAPHCGQKYLPKCKYNYSMDIHTSCLRKSQNDGKVGTAKGEKGEIWPRLWSSGCMVWARWQAKAEGSSARCCSVWRAYISKSQFLLSSHLDSSSNQDLRQTAVEELNQFLSCVHLSLISCRHHRVKCSVCSLVCDQSWHQRISSFPFLISFLSVKSLSLLGLASAWHRASEPLPENQSLLLWSGVGREN